MSTELYGEGRGDLERERTRIALFFKNLGNEKRKQVAIYGELNSKYIAYLGQDLNKYMEVAEDKGQSGPLMKALRDDVSGEWLGKL